LDAITLMLRTFGRSGRPHGDEELVPRPIGEAPGATGWRLAPVRGFFQPGGLPTPDDTVTYEGCQTDFGAQPISFLQG